MDNVLLKSSVVTS